MIDSMISEMIDDKKEFGCYLNIHRIDILYGNIQMPSFPCEICNKKTCKGTGKKCKGHGAWSYGVSSKG